MHNITVLLHKEWLEFKQQRALVLSILFIPLLLTMIPLVALYAIWYNFVRIHKTLRTSPAMAAGIEKRLWSMEDVVALIDEQDERRAPSLANRLVG